MNSTLWVPRADLTATFLAASAMRPTQPADQLALRMASVKTVPTRHCRSPRRPHDRRGDRSVPPQ